MDPDGEYKDDNVSSNAASSPALTASDGNRPWANDRSSPERGRTRHRSYSRSSTSKRPAEETDSTSPSLPFKRRRTDASNAYIDLLNDAIDDAVYQGCDDDEESDEDDDGGLSLEDSRIGLTHWSSEEKLDFFGALARFGRHDLHGIAARLETKSVVKVKHYLDLLQDALASKLESDSSKLLQIAEYPAAVELSQPCCDAQEEAADDISLAEEDEDEMEERVKWGSRWNITPTLASTLDENPDDDTIPPFAQLFHTSTWLELSARVFLNSAIPHLNWTFVEHEPPSMWASTFAKFHALAVSVTRRLVQTTLFITMSRLRTKKELRSDFRHAVRKRDVEAAVASLGLKLDSGEFWRSSAQRLRIDVVDDESDQYQWAESGDDEASTTRVKVENLDGNGVDAGEGEGEGEADDAWTDAAEEEATSHQADDDDDDDANNDAEEDGDDIIDEDDPDTDGVPLTSPSIRSRRSTSQNSTSSSADHPLEPHILEQQSIKREADEITKYSISREWPDEPAARQALEQAIAHERRQEDEADQRDAYNSFHAELDMWDILERKPPPTAEGLREVRKPKPLTRRRSDECEDGGAGVEGVVETDTVLPQVGDVGLSEMVTE